jgi:hypothetical protein
MDGLYEAVERAALQVQAGALASPLLSASWLPALLPPPMVALADAVEAAAVSQAAQLGLPADHFKYVVCLLLAYPVAFVHRYAPHPPPHTPAHQHPIPCSC